jgi:uncharacterized membrane protein
MSVASKKGKLKGFRGLAETAQFATDYPTPLPGMRRVLSVTTFDTWAESNGYYSTNCEQATLLMDRNNLRKKINATGSSEAWRALNNVPFAVEVHDHGKTYKVVRAEDSFSIKADRLPQQVRQYAGTKRDRIQALLMSIDLGKLPPAMQMRVLSLDREVDRYLRGIDYQTSELNREYEAIRMQIEQMVRTNQIAPDNSGFAQLLAPDPDPDVEDDGEDQPDIFG